jgi:hypothetical protein
MERSVSALVGSLASPGGETATPMLAVVEPNQIGSLR